MLLLCCATPDFNRESSVVNLSENELKNLRAKMRAKVRYHLGSYCPDIEDVVQESMTRWIRAEQDGKMKHPENPGAFVSGICNHVISEYRRRVWRDPAGTDELDQHPSKEISPAQDLELRDAVAAALADLLERDCRILTGIYLEGKSPEEVCAENGIAESHLKVVLFRAKARFREVYLSRVKPRALGSHLASE